MAKLYGKGTIKEVIKGKKYYITMSCGKNPITGKYDRYFETFLGTKRQAELRVEEIRRELEDGKAPNADKLMFCDLMQKYLDMREGSGKYRPKTIKQDKSLSKHLIKILGGVRVVVVTPAMVDGLHLSMREAGVGDTTVRQAHKLLKRVMDYAVRNDVIARNPVDRSEAPKKPKPKRQALSIEDSTRLARLCSSGRPVANEVAVYLGLATGARLGEILGLEWRNVVLDGRPFVHIVQQYTAQCEIAPLKTDRGDEPAGRVVPIDFATVALLESWRAVQLEQLNSLGMEPSPSTPVITSQVGRHVNHSCFERWFRSFCVSNGFGSMVADDGRRIVELAVGDDASMYAAGEYLVQWKDAGGWPCDEDGRRYSRTYPRPKIGTHYEGLHFHALRHTHFTIRLASGMDIPTAQALGGWSTPDVLMSVYAHPVAQNIWDSAGFMDKLTAYGTARKGGA